MPERIQQPFCFSYSDAESSPHVGAPFEAAEVQTVALPKDGILLIDDSEDDAELSLRTLRTLGLRVPITWMGDSCCAVEALERAEGEALPRLVLLDLRMPRVDGFEALRRIRANPHSRELPVIVMVGAARAPELPRCFSLGANSYVVKPLHRDSFFAACGRAALEWKPSSSDGGE